MKNGVVQVQGYGIGATARFECAEYFNMLGVQVRQCLLNGEWSGIAPTCISMSQNLKQIINLN